MQISRALFNQMVHLFVDNTAMLPRVADGQVKIEAVNIAFTPGLDRVLADVPAQTTLMTSAVNILPTAGPQEFTDALTQERVGVFGWDVNPGVMQRTSGGAAITIHGVRLVTFDGAALLATKTLPDPVPLAAIGHGFEAPKIEFRFPPDMVR